MAEKSHINWTDYSWNPWQGCKHVSPGCANCYMFTEKRERWHKDPELIHRSAKGTFNKPLTIKEPALVFTCSWSDFFIKEADGWRADAWDIIRRTPHITYQILTKRPSRIKHCLPDDWGDGYPNVWIGVSVESQDQLRRVEVLADISAAVRFISYEPALGPVQWGDALDSVQWLICGGESGPGARPFDLAWARSTLDECMASDTAFWFKQVGTVTFGDGEGPTYYRQKKQLQEAVPDDLRIRMWPDGWDGAESLRYWRMDQDPADISCPGVELRRPEPSATSAPGAADLTLCRTYTFEGLRGCFDEAERMTLTLDQLAQLRDALDAHIKRWSARS